MDEYRKTTRQRLSLQVEGEDSCRDAVKVVVPPVRAVHAVRGVRVGAVSAHRAAKYVSFATIMCAKLTTKMPTAL